jgi:hypothetical protein
MFFDQLDERNAMMKSIIAFEEVGLVGLADSTKSRFVRSSTKYGDPCMFSGHLDERNMMMKSIMHFGQFWVSTLCKEEWGQQLIQE